MKNIFANKTIIVTGGNSGIGASLVAQLASLGGIVAVIDRTPEKISDTFYVRADMAEYDQARAAFKTILGKFNHIDYVINCAGIFMGGEIRDTPMKDWHTVIDNNIYAVAHGAELAYQQMIKQQDGHIINVASTAGLIPVPAMGIYGSTKYALVGLSHAMRNEGAHLGVKVSVACPTIVNTPLYDTAIYNKIDKKRLLQPRDKRQTSDIAAKKIIKGIVRNKSTIHTSSGTHFFWIVGRLAPALYDASARKIIASYRSKWRKG